MKCEQLVTMFKVVFDDGNEMLLEQKDFETWYLQAEDFNLTVSEMYDVVKDILESSDKMSGVTILVPILNKEIAINSQRTKEEYLAAVIGDEFCDSSIDRG